MHVLLDLRGLVLRAYHAGDDLDPRLNPAGEKINTAGHGLNNFVRFVLDPVLEQYKPHQIIGVLDGSNDRRRALYEGYKARRSKKEYDPIELEETEKLLDAAKNLLVGIGASLTRTASCEADDTIAYLAKKLEGAKVIYTVDGDLSQLVSDDVFVIINGEPVETSYKGVPCDLIALHKSIVGDTSDEYPGVRGMGPAAWQGLVEAYGFDGMRELRDCVVTKNFQMMQDALAEQDNKHLKKLFEERSQWELMYNIAQLHPEWCEGAYHGKIVSLDWFKRVPSHDRVNKILTSLKLDFLKERFEQWLPTMWVIDADNFDPEKDIAEFVEVVKQSPCVAFDFETYDTLNHEPYQRASKRGNYVDVLSQVPTGMSMTFGNNLQYTFYLPINHKDAKNLPMEVILDFLGAIPDEIPIVAHNAVFELVVLARNLKAYPAKVHDTMIMSSYVDENEESALKLLSKRVLNYDQITYDQVTKGRAMNELTVDEVVQYGCDDAICTAHLWVHFKKILEIENTWNFVEKYEFDVAYVLMHQFMEGVRVDWDRLEELDQADKAAYRTKRLELISLLTQHCSQYNDEGFKVLMRELHAFKKAVWERIDEKSPEDVKARADAYEQHLKEATRFIPPGPDPELLGDPTGRKALGKVSSYLGFPAIRAGDPAKLATWLDSIERQVKDGGFALKDEAHRFLGALRKALPHLKTQEGPEYEELKTVCIKTIKRDESNYVGDELNVDSPAQMVELLHGKMNLPILTRGENDDDSQRSKVDMGPGPSTNMIALQTHLAELDKDSWQHRVVELIIELRAILTRGSLYYTPWPLWRSPEDNRMHPQIKNCGTVTRRPSGTAPNLLQVSKLKDEGRLRSCILPRTPDEVVVCLDFVQQELMILAADSKDENLRACYVGDNKRDVHSNTAAGLMRLAYDVFVKALKESKEFIYKERRKVAKVVNFLTSYGGTAAGLSRKAIIPRRQAEEFLEGFFATYPKVRAYQKETIRFAERHGYVLDCFGNRKHCWDILSKDGGVKGSAERQAINYPIQGGAASILKKVMSDCRNTELFEQTGSVLIAPVYDEIAASVPKASVVEYITRLRTIMEIVIPGSDMRLVADVSLGRSWGEQIELGQAPTAEAILKAVAESEQPKGA